MVTLAAATDSGLSAPVSRFNWSSLSPKDEKWLRETTGAIRLTCRRAAADIVLIGQKLIEVKKRLGHGRWGAWVDSEFAWRRSQAHRLMCVAEAFGGFQISQNGRFEPSALYMLSQPSTPGECRVIAVSYVSEGKTVTLDVAKSILEAHRPVPVAHSELKEETVIESEEPTPAKDPLWMQCMAALVEENSQLHISVDIDDETGDRIIHGRAYPTDDSESIRFASADRIEELFVKLSGREPERKCRRCKQIFRLFESFARDANGPDGRLSRCKSCERKRMVGANAKRRAKK